MNKLLFVLLTWCTIFHLPAQSVDIYERPLQSAPSHAFDVLHYKIELDFDAKNRAFQGKTTITIRSLSDLLTRFNLHAETFQVSEINLPGTGPIDFQQEDGQLKLKLPAIKKYNDTFQISIAYACDHFEVDPSAYGMGANYPLGLGFFEANEEHPFLFNAYSFPEGARHWFPCYDHPQDRATHETIITTQADHKVLANGLLISSTQHDNGTVTYHWSQKQAHPTYLYNFVSGPYAIVEDQYKDISVNYWVYPGDEDKARRSFHRTPEVLAFFEGYYGVKYPWDKYDQICVPGIGGGAEATTATLIGASTLHDEKAEKDFPSHWLVAHEAAHHWWGDFISYSDWTQTWMSESFATFSEYLYSEHLYGPDEGALNLYNKRSAYLNEVENRYQRPIVFNQWEFPNQNFDRHTYQKGALVLNMLRSYLGEDNFRRVLKHFLTQHAYQPVDSHDFMKSILEVTGQNLDWFFEQWIFKAGHPILDIAYEWQDGQVILNVQQIQETDKNVPIFKMPLQVAITTASDTATYTVWMDAQSQKFTFNYDKKPLLVRFDPEHILLKEWTFKKSKAELLLQARSDNALGRMWAVQQLAEYQDQEEVIDFLKFSSLEDPFWAVRRAALKSLAGSPQDLQTHLKLVLDDPHSQVRTTAIQMLGDLKLSSLQTMFIDFYKIDDSYVVQAAAIRALGTLKNAKHQDFFEKVRKQPSPRNIIQRAADWALLQLE